jgi:hypothetical protein
MEIAPIFIVSTFGIVVFNFRSTSPEGQRVCGRRRPLDVALFAELADGEAGSVLVGARQDRSPRV